LVLSLKPGFYELFHHHEQFIPMNRFGDVFIHACCQKAFPVPFDGMGGQGDDWDAGDRALDSDGSGGWLRCRPSPAF
jgi:hypothetical protein